jgi:hypothetical protein
MLREIIVWKSKAKLKEMYQYLLKKRIEMLKELKGDAIEPSKEEEPVKEEEVVVDEYDPSMSPKLEDSIYSSLIPVVEAEKEVAELVLFEIYLFL